MATTYEQFKALTEELEALETAFDLRKHELLDAIEAIKATASDEQQKRDAMAAAGFSAEAIEAAISAHFGHAVEVPQPIVVQFAEDKVERKRMRTDDVILLVKAHLDTSWKTSREIQEESGLDKTRILRALNALIEKGEARAEGRLSGRTYRLAV